MTPKHLNTYIQRAKQGCTLHCSKSEAVTVMTMTLLNKEINFRWLDMKAWSVLLEQVLLLVIIIVFTFVLLPWKNHNKLKKYEKTLLMMYGTQIV